MKCRMPLWVPERSIELAIERIGRSSVCSIEKWSKKSRIDLSESVL